MNKKYLIFLVIFCIVTFVLIIFGSLKSDNDNNTQDVMQQSAQPQPAEVNKQIAPSSLDDYVFYLKIANNKSGKEYNDINMKDINAANIAVQRYQEKYQDKQKTAEAEDGFLGFLAYYTKFVGAQDKISVEAENIMAERSSIPYEELSKLADIEQVLKDRYEKYGLDIAHDEGYFYAVKSYKYLSDNFDSYLPEPWGELFNIEMKYSGTIISDAHFTIEKTELQEMISLYEKFLAKYPEFCAKYLNIDKVISTYKRALNTYPSVGL